MPKHRVALLASLAVLATSAAVLTGCGGSSSGSGGGGGKVSLVAYSTPQEAYQELIPAFQKTPGGQGRELPAVLRRIRRPGAARSRPACPPTWWCSRSRPTSTKLVKAGLVSPSWDEDQ